MLGHLECDSYTVTLDILFGIVRALRRHEHVCHNLLFSSATFSPCCGVPPCLSSTLIQVVFTLTISNVSWVTYVMALSISVSVYRAIFSQIQGAKAAQKRERNADKNAKKGSTSQTKSNEAAKNIICETCRQTFVRASRSQVYLSTHLILSVPLRLFPTYQLVTTRLPQLQQHVDNKHNGKTVKDCFPKYEGA